MIEQAVRKYSLARNHSNAIPRHLICVDTETLPVANDSLATTFTHKFRLGVAKCCRLIGTEDKCHKTVRLKQPGDFMKLLIEYTREGQTTWVVAHNTLFDFITLQLPSAFERGELLIDWPRSKRKPPSNDSDHAHCGAYAVVKSPPTIIGCRVSNTQGRVVMVDTLNWFNCSLAELGRELGYEKLPMPDFAADDKEWWQYCERDCELVQVAFLALIRWVKQCEFGMFRYTAPSQAWSAYRHRFMDYCIYPHDNEQVTILERQSYFGGRSECLRLGQFNEPLYKVDVSSLYPSVMLRNLFPAELINYERRTEYMGLLPSTDLAATVAECDLIASPSYFPKRTNGPTIYPAGTVRTTLAGPELAYAAKNNCILGIRSWACYKLQPLFTRWVDELWSMRLRYEAGGELIYAALTKKLLNSLQGKFSERGQEWEVVDDEPVIAPWSRWERVDLVSGERTKFRSFGWTAEKYLGEQEKAGRMVAISAWITAYGRLRMNRLREIAGDRNVYYQAVDALIVNADGMANLRIADEVYPRELGKLRIVDKAADGEIIGIGDYRIGDNVVCAGRAGRAKELEKDTFECRRFIGRERLFDGRAVEAMEEQVDIWRRSGYYAKGVLGEDGWVRPYKLADCTSRAAPD